jgi:hypothetical protein
MASMESPGQSVDCVAPPVGAAGYYEGARAVHPEHGPVDVLAAVGPQRLIRVPTGPGPSRIAVLAVHVGERRPAVAGPAQR